VVLSACGTALGPAVVGEGVFGLRMAFTAAGAGTVISSLWPVDDQLTLEYMRALYDARFPGGRDAPEAMRDAARAILRRFRAAGLTAGTGLWGAFLAVGPPDAGPAPRASR
jgi:CHAT domain-containing protein